MSGLRVSVYGVKELQAVILAMKALDRDLKKTLRAQTREVVGAIWKQSIAENVQSRMESRVLGDTARVKVSDQNVTLTSASVGRKMSGGVKPSEVFASVEFGNYPERRRTYTARSKRGNSYDVTRRTAAQFRPKNREGYVVWPAAAEAVPRIAALWVQTIARGIHEAFEKR
ncbi:hypothetical protein D9V30_00615 [Mycetocola reblochoni]|uniref:HK97 gp10 family phage protein n=2 Tax=Mycetocola reblochoni TaxID=331618 RepID=A0A1R4IX22_9MICO|nr:hypothetical protein [Mycetocola reblochoni]RLP70969.1 hypothetical protein D9V30_00615 [Mycetocola reblochoni]SJN24105.1 hypothetical protein FM119_04010 [Mycetocola reblochoni REB411]